ncbi:DUF1049 domain-containing protein [Streptosporangium carneum]|uniref:DUF1049 domain-containing protein n=1 Tax=Streptosporangium carneum TaxID=47481 RepID=A0A9W6HYR4_9ACTN|nr:DUF1049 domain-containing protein [Streptosporangium carneum]GLK07835.1 hypothetical protein GCM10017600_12400 [Streptosporangium carneum]
MTSTPAAGPAPAAGSRSFWRRIAAAPPRLWVALALLALGVSFVAQNRGAVRIRWLVLDVTSPLWAALLAMLLVGVLIGLLARRWPPKRR